MSQATAKWLLLALLGMIVAGAVAFAASQLISEQIGIASESVSAGDELAPVVGSAVSTRDVARPPARDGPTGPGASGPARAPGDTGGTPSDADALDALEDLEDARRDAREDREDQLEDAREDREDEREDREDD